MTVDYLKALLCEYDEDTTIEFLNEEHKVILDLVKVSHEMDLTEDTEVLKLKFYNYVE